MQYPSKRITPLGLILAAIYNCKTKGETLLSLLLDNGIELLLRQVSLRLPNFAFVYCDASWNLSRHIINLSQKVSATDNIKTNAY